MHQEVPGVESFFVETQTHGFCVSAEQSGALWRLQEGDMRVLALLAVHLWQSLIVAMPVCR